ncbi:hypothetical protein [Cryomorpha ignava]|nr:hypothetical protein [Cryomorpha ignava]
MSGVKLFVDTNILLYFLKALEEEFTESGNKMILIAPSKYV